jgi:hypothetical protein
MICGSNGCDCMSRCFMPWICGSKLPHSLNGGAHQSELPDPAPDHSGCFYDCRELPNEAAAIRAAAQNPLSASTPDVCPLSAICLAA